MNPYSYAAYQAQLPEFQPVPYTLTPEADAALEEYDSLGSAAALDEYGSIGFETACMAAEASPSQPDFNATSPEALAAMGPESVMDDRTATYLDAWCGPDCEYDAAAEAEAGS